MQMFDPTSSLFGQQHRFRALVVGAFGAPSAAIALFHRLVRAITTRSRFGSMHRPNWCPLNRVNIPRSAPLRSPLSLGTLGWCASEPRPALADVRMASING